MVEYVGLDVSKQETHFCVKDESGRVLAQGCAATDPQALFDALKEHTLCPQRIVMETGSLSAWLARGLSSLGLPVEVIDAREAHGLLKLQRNKSDASDADLLADISRCNLGRIVDVGCETASRQRMLLQARAHLVQQRVALHNTVRGLLNAVGLRFEKGKGRLVKRVREAIAGDEGLVLTIAPLLEVIEALEKAIARLDKAVRKATRQDSSCRLLMSAPGVGPVTALAFVSTIGDPKRFKHSSDVGAYLGLTVRRHQSGEVDRSGRISKFGDAMLRGLLYEVANSMLCVVRKAHPVKDWARGIKKRSCHKKACVALARRMAVILHRMLVTGETFRWPQEHNPTPAREAVA